MDNDEIHFLDTNIILAMVLPNDSSYNICKNYLEYDHVRYLSRTACDEAENKITKIRRISLKITNYTKKYSMKNKINPLKLDIHLSNVEKGFLMQYSGNDFPEQLKKENFISLVSNFFNEYRMELNNILLTHNTDTIDELIRSSFRSCIIKLNDFIKEQYPISFIKNAIKVEEFREVGIHKPDSILLEESYFLYQFLNEKIYFITFDRGILNLKSYVRKILSFEIKVVHPRDYIN